MWSALLVVASYVAVAVLGGWGFFRRYRVVGPPLGVVNLADVAIMLAFIVVVPYLFLTLPLWAVALVFGVAVLSALYSTLVPMLRWRGATTLASLGLVGADVALAFRLGVTAPAFLAVNDTVLVLVVVGATNLWARSGMKARDVSILAAALAIYDLIVSWQFPVMVTLLDRFSQLPLFPMIAWPIGAGEAAHAGSGAVLSQILGVGLGDVLLATVFPLTMRKAFGRAAGLAAMALTLATVVGALVLLSAGLVTTGIPVMSFLGPLMVAQYAYWRRTRGGERTVAQYLRAEPRGSTPEPT
jgi:hypothetical protein